MTHPDIDMAAATAAARDILRDQVDRIEQARASQPARLAAARTEADEAREQSLLIEPWSEQLSALRAHTRDGQPTAQTLPLPNVIAKEMFGARLAFDLLDAGTDDDRRADILSQTFAMCGGDTGQTMLLMSAALDTIAGIVEPQLLDEIEQAGSNYDARVLLADARGKAWRGRIAGHHLDPEVGR